MSGHKCVGFCEFDKFATASYTSMHLITEMQREYLSKLTLKKRQKEILKEEYRNGEWYANDIRAVDARSLPKADCWTFGAPCQDFSVAGKRAGLDGDRSSLIREIFRLLEEQEEKDRPEWLIYENVKGMLSSNRGLDYLSILSEMDRLGYDIEWQNINSKWFVPQNRERIYTIGHLRRCGSRKVLPVTGADGESCLFLVGCNKGRNSQRDRIYGYNGIAPTVSTCPGGNTEPKVAVVCNINPSGNGMNGNVFDSNGLNCSLTTNKGEGNKVAIPVKYGSQDVVKGEIDIAQTMLSSDYKGITGRNQDNNAVLIPILTPDRSKKRQNGRRFKENGEEMFTLTAQDRHGVGVGLIPLGVLRNTRSEYGKKIRKDYESGKLNISRHDFLQYEIKTDGNSNTISTVAKDNYVSFGIKSLSNNSKKQGIFVKINDTLTVYAIWYEKYQCYIAIRRLTPKECFRLQGWTDDYFEKAEFVNSDSQLYKQAGNGVTVDVVEQIGKKICV